MNPKYEDFIKLNFQMALNLVLERARKLDLEWENIELRSKNTEDLLALIEWSRDHKHEDVREIFRLKSLF